MRESAGGRPPAPTPEGWLGGPALGLFLGALALATAGLLGVSGWIPAPADSSAESGATAALFAALGWTAAMGAASVAILRARGWSWRRLGLRARDFVRTFRFAVAAEGVTLLALGAWATVLARFEAPVADPFSPLLRAGGPAAAAFVFAVVVVAPWAEEMIFRGLLFGLARERLGRRGAVVATAVLFGLVHGGWRIPGMVLMGLALGYARARTRSLAAPITMHMLNNAAAVALMFLF